MIIVENDGRGERLGETTFIIGEMIFLGLICSFSFVVEIVSRLSDSRNLERNTSATSFEPNVVFNALERKRFRSFKTKNSTFEVN